MAIHSSTIAWKIPWTEEPGRLVYGVAESDMTERLHFHFHACFNPKFLIGFPLLPLLSPLVMSFYVYVSISVL